MKGDDASVGFPAVASRQDMKTILIIGGTRNIGYLLAHQLSQDGHRVTLLNRGITPEDLPEDLPRLRCDRTEPAQLRRALHGRTFDVVVDMVLYKGQEAEDIVSVLSGSIGHYLFISTGQVYLVREGLRRPFTEADYDGALIPAPPGNTYDYEEWLYGYDKRQAEDALAKAYAERGFPYTSLRIPMVNSARDTFRRLYSYMLRIRDGGPILVPDAPDYPLRHIYAPDVVQAVRRLIDRGPGPRRAYNISQEETLTIDDFLALLAGAVGMPVHIERVPRALLEANGFLPDCSPFSDVWMSELDNTLSKAELGMVYTPLAQALTEIVAEYNARPPAIPSGYIRRNAEKFLLMPNG